MALPTVALDELTLLMSSDRIWLLNCRRRIREQATFSSPTEWVRAVGSKLGGSLQTLFPGCFMLA